MHRLSVTAIVISLLPVLGLVRGDQGLAFTMYASLTEFRLVFVGTEPSGRKVAVAPTALASRVGPTVAPVLSGADHFRRVIGRPPLRAHLHELARLACNEANVTAIDATLEERFPPSERIESAHARVECVAR